ncbi:MAG: hypothetical protein BWZ09_02008 [Alphaproteobacteria bacterium ADurb.BinA305]|nr:MAG: hypothetical protein BWZ09_02008 [Alphaproteobacteria bacterium ADurb.BinA305]
MAAHAVELLLQRRQRGDRGRGGGGQGGAAGVVADALEAVLDQEELAGGGGVQRRARAHDVHHAHRGAPARGALDIHDLVAGAHPQVHALAGGGVQLEHVGHRGLAQRDARLHQAAELEQADPEPVGAGLRALDEAAVRHRAEDAVRGRRMQPGLDRELLELDRIGMFGQHVEQLHHAFDDLDRGLAFGTGGGFGLLRLHGGSGKDRKLAGAGKEIWRMVPVRSDFA